MKKNSFVTIGALLLSSGLASVVFAQSSTGQSSPTTESAPQVTMTPPKPDGGYTATFTGCVERSTQEAAASATPESAKADNNFVLTHALRGTADGIPAAVGTSGGASGHKDITYKLDAAGPALTPHVGHLVEVTGFVTVVMGGKAVATADGALASLGGTPQVTVEKIRTISETCGRPSQ